MVFGHAISAEGIQGMQKNRQSELLAAREHGPQLFLVEVFPHDMRAHIDTAYAWKLRGALHLPHRELRRLHGQCSESEKAVRVLAMRLRKTIVIDLRELSAE